MFRLQISSPSWILRTFLSIGWCLSLFQQAQTAAVTDPIEVIALKSLARKWSTGINTSNTWKTWDLAGDPCTGRATDNTPITDTSMNPAFKCDCTYNNGATCHISNMKVYAMDITGEIPEELANLTYISDLNLAQNYLTGPIPAFLGNLTSMQYLTVGINNLSGPVPKELGNLQKLISLSFGSNSLNGTLPPELGNLTALEQMYIDSAGLSGEIPSTLRKLQNLKILWASDNQFTGEIPDFIGSWKSLTDLRLQGNSFKGPIPSSFSNLTSLTNLRVSDIMLGASSLSFLKNLTKLSQLVLRNNMISGELPLYLGELSELQQLITELEEQVGSLRNLVTLLYKRYYCVRDLGFNNFMGGIPNSLQNLSNLQFLFLGNNNLSGDLPSQKSASLAYILFWLSIGCNLLSKNHLQAHRTGNRNLIRLRCSYFIIGHYHE